MENMSELEKKREELKGLENNKSSVFQKDEITKRNFYLQLFRTYCELPF
jgi:hypothetical protein